MSEMVHNDGTDLEQCMLRGRVLFKARVSGKATASERIIYLEAANEKEDLQDEHILQSALWNSRDYYVAKGNLDLDHVSKLGIRLGVPEWWTYEIGKPIDVAKTNDGRTWVKAYLYGGGKAEGVWQSLHYDPPQVWWASVSGAILGRAKNDHRTITEVRWNNTGLTGEAVNHTLKQPVSLEAIAAFAKGASTLEAVALDSMLAGLPQLDAVIFAKALTAGYGTDTAQLSGGGALRHESVAGARVGRFKHFRTFASQKLLEHGTRVVTKAHLHAWARECGYDDDGAGKAVEQFFKDLTRDVGARQKEAA